MYGCFTESTSPGKTITASLDDSPAEVVKRALEKKGKGSANKGVDAYILQVEGRNDFLHPSYMLGQYRAIRRALAASKGSKQQGVFFWQWPAFLHVWVCVLASERIYIYVCVGIWCIYCEYNTLILSVVMRSVTSLHLRLIAIPEHQLFVGGTGVLLNVVLQERDKLEILQGNHEMEKRLLGIPPIQEPQRKIQPLGMPLSLWVCVCTCMCFTVSSREYVACAFRILRCLWSRGWCVHFAVCGSKYIVCALLRMCQDKILFCFAMYAVENTMHALRCVCRQEGGMVRAFAIYLCAEILTSVFTRCVGSL